MSDRKRRVGALFFERFELLDIFGPLEMFGVLTDHFEVLRIGERSGSIASTQGPRVVVDADYASVGQLDVLLVPRGVGTREEVDNRLQMIMKDIHAACLQAAEKFSTPGNYVNGANIAGFLKVADSMLDQGVV